MVGSTDVSTSEGTHVVRIPGGWGGGGGGGERSSLASFTQLQRWGDDTCNTYPEHKIWWKCIHHVRCLSSLQPGGYMRWLLQRKLGEPRWTSERALARS